MKNIQSGHNTSLHNPILVALSLNAQKRIQSHTIEEQQAAWQGYSNGSEIVDKTALLEAIDSDPDKFELWIKSKPIKQHQHGFNFNVFRLWFSELRLSKLGSSWKLPVAFAATLVFSVIIVSLMIQPNQSPLQESYAQVLEIYQQDKDKAEPLPLTTIEGQSYSFSGSASNQSHIRAFLNGIEVGRAQLQLKPLPSPSADLKDSAWQELGQWYQLNRYVVNNNYQLDSSYWQRQQAILITLQTALKASPSFKPIHNALNKLQENPQLLRNTVKLKRGLNEYWKALQVSQNAN